MDSNWITAGRRRYFYSAHKFKSQATNYIIESINIAYNFSGKIEILLKWLAWQRIVPGTLKNWLNCTRIVYPQTSLYYYTL